MVYKKEIYGLDKAKELEYVMSNNGGVYINTTVIGMPNSSSHGLYIKQKQNEKDEVYLAGVLENIEFDEIGENISILSKKVCRDMSIYFNKFELKHMPISEYILNNVKVVKNYMLSTDNVLCISYVVENTSKRNCKIKIEPLVTKRDLYITKRIEDLKMTNQIIESGVKVNLSITDKLELYIQSKNMKYMKKERYLNGLIYNQNISENKRKTLIEDLYIPGIFELNAKSKSKLEAQIYISLEDTDIDVISGNGEFTYSPKKLEENHINVYKRDTINILDEYHELKSLSTAASCLKYIDRQNKNMVILDSIPKENMKLTKFGESSNSSLTNKILSIDGNYISLGRNVEANKILMAMKKKLDERDDKSVQENSNNILVICEDILSFIEQINRYIQAVEYEEIETKLWYTYIKRKIEDYLNKKDTGLFVDKDYLISINNEKYIKINSLWYNAIKIYEDLERKYNKDFNYDHADYIYNIGENIKKSIEEKFWDNEKKILKYSENSESYATIDMIYSLAFSYMAIDEKIAIRIVDTAFKELYTPYGIRLAQKNSKKYDGYVYPKYMTYFVKANLRQTGITRASQKLAYNLVKDLLGEMDKYTIGSVKEKYLEKTKKAYGPAIDSLTNAEMIRLYKMFI